MKLSEWRQGLKRTLFSENQKRMEKHNYGLFFSYEHAELAFADIAKYFVDTFKPYKRSFHRQRDAETPLWGVTNVLEGAFYIALSSIFFLYALMHIVGGAFGLVYGSDISEAFKFALKTFAVSIATMFLGITQLIATPFIPLRMMYRTYLSRNKENLEESCEERKSVIQLVNLYDTETEESTTNVVLTELIRKGVKSGYLAKNKRLLEIEWYVSPPIMSNGQPEVDENNEPKLAKHLSRLLRSTDIAFSNLKTGCLRDYRFLESNTKLMRSSETDEFVSYFRV